MAHSTNLIHTIKLPDGTSYEVHDAQAVHTLADLAALGMNTEGLFSYQGVVATVAALESKPKTKGHVYHVTEDNSEYVYTGEAWEEFGHHFLVEHKHTVTVSGTNGTSSVSGSATVTGGNSSSSVTGTASITNAPKVSRSQLEYSFFSVF